MTITETIKNVASIYVTTMVNEYEVLVELTAEQALKAISAANASDAVLNPQNDNFYVNPEIRYSQVAWLDGENDTLIIGQ